MAAAHAGATGGLGHPCARHPPHTPTPPGCPIMAAARTLGPLPDRPGSEGTFARLLSAGPPLCRPGLPVPASASVLSAPALRSAEGRRAGVSGAGLCPGRGADPTPGSSLCAPGAREGWTQGSQALPPSVPLCPSRVRRGHLRPGGIRPSPC